MRNQKTKAEEKEKMVQSPIENADEAKIHRRPVLEAVIKNSIMGLLNLVCITTNNSN